MTAQTWVPDAGDTEHLDGVKWFEAPPPLFVHRHWAQTRGWIKFSSIERCPCGAIRYDLHGWFFGSLRESTHRRARWLP